MHKCPRHYFVEITQIHFCFLGALRSKNPMCWEREVSVQQTGRGGEASIFSSNNLYILSGSLHSEIKNWSCVHLLGEFWVLCTLKSTVSTLRCGMHVEKITFARAEQEYCLCYNRMANTCTFNALQGFVSFNYPKHEDILFKTTLKRKMSAPCNKIWRR